MPPAPTLAPGRCGRVVSVLVPGSSSDSVIA